MAYQAYAGGLDAGKLRMISNWASEGIPEPHATYFLDVRPAIGLSRAASVERTRFEDKSYEYHGRVRAGFIRQRTESWVVINAEESVSDVHKLIRTHALAMYLSKERVKM